ncbi:40-residue YVTN family beta-propeller repeat-containing protein [Streptomyces sp. 2224.1]|uniref:IPT/TIG domain-containing protein n=1 Tax=unclassified Streptomyces TaxID=2593676 RepID=UPI000885D490|nr:MULTISPECIES: IPT/TIG domain-containing protein [unclassified Streptomyces]PBC80309.1 YVTN family beta-propeller protein [Streptomyces sp. 2321.6]SDR59277.1 40-residue YVTN family beta-propeller repeat-containing protein [Streptomyces sp. KS_16]SEB69848.1 40-residue YVTN family beta-propeller repeat-containing protein [Streptomyces sp. 2133.1]SED53755.1 40-residue YVTN family beta-propeller repeat-containing protein [Streptomyces sp. 2224.1]SNC59778.1 40-residue YVTN family beta-propeller r
MAPAGTSAGPTQGAPAGALQPPVHADGVPGRVDVTDTDEPLTADEILVGHAPIWAAITPDGRRVYVTNFGAGSISVIDTRTRDVIATIGVASGPWEIAITPDGLRAYAACFGTDSVAVIDTATNTVTTTIEGLDKPLGLKATPDGSRLYVASLGGSRVDVISTATDTLIASVPVSSGPRGVAVTPDGAQVYVTEEGANAVEVIDTATDTVIETITGFLLPRGVAVSPDGQRAYVSEYGGNRLGVVDTATHTRVAALTGLPIPLGVAVGHNGVLAYVTCDADDSVAVIDLIRNEMIDKVPGFHAPSWLVITPDDVEVYVVNNANETVSVLAAPSGGYPNVGPMAGGTPVTLLGEGLGNTTAVRFGGHPASFIIVNNREIRAVSPLLVRDVSIDVTLGQHTTRTVGRFSYLPDSLPTRISPASGPLGGGGTLTVTGRGLITTTSVHFGSVAVTPSSVLDDQVTVTVPPAQTAGPVPVTVVTRSNSYGTATYTYVGPPNITSVTPATGSTAGGHPVLIEGAELACTQSVTIGGAAAAFGIVSPTRIAVVTPPADAPGPADVVVTTAGGTATAPGAFVYT